MKREFNLSESLSSLTKYIHSLEEENYKLKRELDQIDDSFRRNYSMLLRSEKFRLLTALKMHEYTLNKTARFLSMSERTMSRRLSEFNINLKELKKGRVAP